MASFSRRISCARTSIAPVLTFGFTVSGVRASTCPRTAITYSAPEPSGARDERLVVADDDLRHAVAVANIDEEERAEVAKTVHPAEQHDVLADVGSREGTTGVGSREGS